ncbi:MAG: general secretion pathway protein GspB [Gallionellaceae bacterium]|nr:general secretion pathway protein GspB [Gallionellaceae bacterium]
MSFILDALSKAEQLRERNAAPTLLTVPAWSEADPAPGFARYGAIALVLIGAGMAIVWLQPWQQKQSMAATKSARIEAIAPRPRPALPEPLPALPDTTMKPRQEAPAQKPRAVVPPVPGHEAARLEPDLHGPARAPAQPEKTPPGKVAAIAQQAAPPVRETAIATAQEKAVASSPGHTPDVASAAAPLAGEKEISLAELPLTIRQEIPAMSIPLHTYSSTPKERIVGINGRLLQEGDYLLPELRVEQITPDGVVFSYKKYRFSHGL